MAHVPMPWVCVKWRQCRGPALTHAAQHSSADEVRATTTFPVVAAVVVVVVVVVVAPPACPYGLSAGGFTTTKCPKNSHPPLAHRLSF